MSITSRITAMTEHIDDIYDTVELTGVDTTGLNKNLVNVPNTLKDGFVDIINNGVDTLYENFPKVAQTGEEPTLNGVYEAPMRVDLNGNTEQTTYTGKNLFNFNNYYTKSVNVTIDSSTTNTLKASVTTASTWQTAQYIVENLEKNTNYTFWFNFANSNTSSTYANTFLSIKDGNGTNLFNDTYHTSDTITINTGNYTSLRFAFHITMGGTAVTNTLTITQAQLELGTATTYEPYVGGTPSPNPDYPQPIRVVKGDNTIKVTGKNLFDKNNFNMLSANLNNQQLTSGGAERTLWFKCKPNTTYTFTKLFNSPYARNSIAETIEKPALGVSIQNLSKQESVTTFTYTTSATAEYIVWWFYNTSSTNYTLQEMLDSIQIEYGSTATTYQPYQETTYPLNLGTTEVCKIGDYKDEIRKSTGKNLFDKDNVNTLNSYISLGNGKITSSNADKCLYIPIKSNTTYTISKILSSRFVIGCTDELPVVNTTICNPISGNQATNTTYTIISGNNSQYLVVFYYASNTDTLTEQEILDSIQIEENPTATDYEPFGKVWYLKKNIGKIDLSTLTWSSTGSDTSGYRRYYTNTIPNIKYVSSNTQVGNGIAEKYTIVKGQGISNLIDVLAIDVSIVSVIDLESNNNPTGLFYYALATPTYTEITDTDLINQLEDLKTAKSVEGQTNITQTNEELPFILDVSGLKKD